MKDVVMSFKIEEADRDRLKAIAAQRDVPVSQIIREALKLYFQKES